MHRIWLVVYPTPDKCKRPHIRLNVHCVQQSLTYFQLLKEKWQFQKENVKYLFFKYSFTSDEIGWISVKISFRCIPIYHKFGSLYNMNPVWDSLMMQWCESAYVVMRIRILDLHWPPCGSRVLKSGHFFSPFLANFRLFLPPGFGSASSMRIRIQEVSHYADPDPRDFFDFIWCNVKKSMQYLWINNSRIKARINRTANVDWKHIIQRKEGSIISHNYAYCVPKISASTGFQVSSISF